MCIRDSLKKQLETLGPKARDLPFVKKIIGQMDAVAKLTDIPDGSLMSKDDLKKLNQISNELVAAIANA